MGALDSRKMVLFWVDLEGEKEGISRFMLSRWTQEKPWGLGRFGSAPKAD
jgi:hypothetical protein